MLSQKDEALKGNYLEQGIFLIFAYEDVTYKQNFQF